MKTRPLPTASRIVLVLRRRWKRTENLLDAQANREQLGVGTIQTSSSSPTRKSFARHAAGRLNPGAPSTCHPSVSEQRLTEVHTPAV